MAVSFRQIVSRGLVVCRLMVVEDVVVLYYLIVWVCLLLDNNTCGSKYIHDIVSLHNSCLYAILRKGKL